MITGHLIEIVYSRLPVQPYLSIASMVNVNEPSVVGLPLIDPLEVKVRPGGKVP